jgi:hypothetical protein
MESVVLDKSYLEGASRTEVLALRERRRLLMSGALFYELLDTTSEQRRKCFGKLPQVVNPVILVDHVGDLLRRELRDQRPCGKPSKCAIEITFRFNPALLTSSYELPEEARQAMLEEVENLDGERLRLIDLSETANSLFSGLLIGNDVQRSQAREEARRNIADIEWVTGFYGQLGSPDPNAPFPDPSIVGPDWAHLRWLQVQLLFTLDLYVRYQGRLRELLTQSVYLGLEHDLHDGQGLVLGVLEGAFATREKKLARWFTLLRPDGELVQ